MARTIPTNHSPSSSHLSSRALGSSEIRLLCRSSTHGRPPALQPTSPLPRWSVPFLIPLFDPPLAHLGMASFAPCYPSILLLYLALRPNSSDLQGLLGCYWKK